MKSFTNYSAKAILTTLMLSCCTFAMAADLVAWRTEADGNLIGNGKLFNVNQELVGYSTSPTICGPTTVLCQIALTLTANTTISPPTASFFGELHVVGADPLFGNNILPDNISARYPVSGNITINLQTGSGSATGTIIIPGNNTKFTAVLGVNRMIIFDTSANPVYAGNVLRFDLTLQ